MESEPPDEQSEGKKERNFPSLDLQLTSTQPILVVQSPKTPTLSRKLKAASLDSEPQKENASLELSRDVFSMPNTPKRQIKPKLLSEFSDEGQKLSLAPCFPSNLKKFASNTSISGSQTLKTLPEVMTLHDFSFTQNSKPEPVKTRPKGLLERRGSNASLTIDLGSNSSIAEPKVQPLLRLNTARSVSNLNLSTFGTADKCLCMKKFENGKKMCERRKSQEACRNCIIYESVPSKANICKNRCQVLHKRCMCTASKCRRKSLSNENLYVPPCGFCQSGFFKDCVGSSKNCKGDRRACYPRQPDIEVNQLLSEDFKNHLQNMQYLQTAGNVLTIADLKSVCEDIRVPKLHQEFWEVPLNLQEKCYVSGSQTKNRYRGVLPNEHSRVHLPGVQPYIHANYIKGPDYTETNYIATQGPMAHTCQDFWNMVWHTNCQTIVMLTGLVEKGKNKCELYFPLGKKAGSPETSKYYVKTSRLRDKFTFDGRQNLQDNEEELVEFEALDEVTFGNYKIKYLSEENNLQNCPMRYLELSKMNDTNEVQESKRLIRHYWVTNWQDHKMADPRMVLEVALNVLDSFTDMKNDESSKTDSNLTISKDNTLEVQKVEKSIDELKISDKLDVTATTNNKGGLRKFVFNSSDNSKNPFSYTETSNWVEDSKEPVTNDDNPFDIRLRRTPRMMKSQRFTMTKSLETPENKRKLVEIRKFSSCQSREKRKGSSDNLIESSESYRAGTDAGGSQGTGELPKSTINGIFSNHSTDSLMNVQAQRRKSTENIKVSLIVHCSAGIGRTGCFLAILNGIQQLRSNLNVDVLAILCSLRLNRGGMVQTAEQYELIHRVLNLFTDVL